MKTLDLAYQQALIAWYHKEHRPLPWRIDSSPYHTWVSEIMCQQTRVDTVIPYYERFIKTLPTIQALADADEDLLHKLWEGLGYYSRVKNMQIAARQCVEHYQANLPHTYDELLTLKGIGPYSAGAIASLAFHQKVACIDGNVLRVFARLQNDASDIGIEKTKKHFKAQLEAHLPDDIGAFNQGLMELGALICIPNGTPRCSICPLQSYCLAYEAGTMYQLPIKTKKTKSSTQNRTIVLLRYQDQVCIHKRQAQGLLAKLYEFINLEGHYTKNALIEQVVHEPCRIKKLPAHKHVFSHLVWQMQAFEIFVDHPIIFEDYQWVSIMDLQSHYSLPSAFAPYKDYLIHEGE